MTLRHTNDDVGLPCRNTIGSPRGVATELGDCNINVNAISHSATHHEIRRESVTPEAAQDFANQQAIKRPEVPDDLIGTVLFWCRPPATSSLARRSTSTAACYH